MVNFLYSRKLFFNKINKLDVLFKKIKEFERNYLNHPMSSSSLLSSTRGGGSNKFEVGS